MKEMKQTTQLVSTLMLIICAFLTYGFKSENSSLKIKYKSGIIGMLNVQTNPDSVLITGNTNWQIIKTTKQVKISTKEVSCIDSINGISMKKVLLKIENLTSSAITVSWDNKLYYDNVCKTCKGNPAENHNVVNIPANSLVEGSCSGGNPKLTLFIELIGMQSEGLTSFEITNFSIY